MREKISRLCETAVQISKSPACALSYPFPRDFAILVLFTLCPKAVQDYRVLDEDAVEGCFIGNPGCQQIYQ